jgi:hypothetical protein
MERSIGLFQGAAANALSTSDSLAGLSVEAPSMVPTDEHTAIDLALAEERALMRAPTLERAEA